jgi:hypothetical protein
MTVHRLVASRARHQTGLDVRRCVAKPGPAIHPDTSQNTSLTSCTFSGGGICDGRLTQTLP